MEVKKAAVIAVAYRPMLLNAGMVSSEVKTNAFVVTPPPRPMITPPTRQPASNRG